MIGSKAQTLVELLRKQVETQPDIHIGEVQVRARRNDLLGLLYEAGIVEASEYSAHAADKLFIAYFLRCSAPEAYSQFHPRTEGLDGYLSSEEPQAAIMRDFPNGFIVKPVGSMCSDGENVYSSERFFSAFETRPADFCRIGEETCSLTGVVSSGERYLIQENIGERKQEYRLHTLGKRIVRNASYTRWNDEWNLDELRAAEESLQDFLSQLPWFVTARQAWSLDVMGTSESGFKIVEINTNRGKRGHWSGDLEIPDTLAAYANHLEMYYGAKFLGDDGEKLRSATGSDEKFLEKFGAEEVARHKDLRRRLAQR